MNIFQKFILLFSLILMFSHPSQAQSNRAEKSAVDLGEVITELYMITIVCEGYLNGPSEYKRELDIFLEIQNIKIPDLWAAYEVRRDMEKKGKKTIIKSCKSNLERKINKYDAVRENFIKEKLPNWPNPPLIVNLDR